MSTDFDFESIKKLGILILSNKLLFIIDDNNLTNSEKINQCIQKILSDEFKTIINLSKISYEELFEECNKAINNFNLYEKDIKKYLALI